MVCSAGAVPAFYLPPAVCEGNPIDFDGSASQDAEAYFIEVCSASTLGSHTVSACQVCTSDSTDVPSTPIDLVVECPAGYFTPGDYRVKLTVESICGR